MILVILKLFLYDSRRNFTAKFVEYLKYYIYFQNYINKLNYIKL